MVVSDRHAPIGCDEACHLIMPLLANDPILTTEQRKAFAIHILLCNDCFNEFEDSKYALRMIKEGGSSSRPDHTTDGTRWQIPGLPCEQARQLLDRVATENPGISGEEGVAFALHIANCSECAKAFYIAEGMNEDGTFKPEDLLHYADIESTLMSVDEGWQNMLLRFPELAQSYYQRPVRQYDQLFWRIGKAVAMAACFALLVGGCWLLSMRISPTFVSVAGQSMAEREKKSAPANQALITSQTDNELLEMAHSLQQQAVPDVDTLDYTAWRDKHESFFAALFNDLAAIRKSQVIRSDYVEMLMMSGAIWQFNYDPRLPSDQPITKPDPETIALLGKHYGISEQKIMLAAGLSDSAFIFPSSVQKQHLGQQYAVAMRKWHDALATAVPNPDGNRNLMLFSLRATQYLFATQTAAYLWTKAHPQEAHQLFADATYSSVLPAFYKGLNDDQLLKQLRQQAIVAHNCAQITTDWLLMPVENGCKRQTSNQQQNLAALVKQLSAALPRSVPE